MHIESKAEKIRFGALCATILQLLRFSKEYFWGWGLVRFIGGYGSAIGNLALAKVSGSLLDLVLAGDKGRLPGFILSLLLILVLRTALAYSNSLSIYRYNTLSGQKMRRVAVEKINSLPIAYFDTRHSAQVISRVMNDIEKLQNFYGDAIAGTFSFNPASFFIGIFLLGDINWTLTGICLVVVPLISFLLGKISLPVADRSLEVQEKTAEANAYLRDFLEGAELYKIFGMQRSHGRHYERAVQSAAQAQIRAQARRNFIWAMNNFNYIIPWLLSYSVGGVMAFRGSLTVGTLYAFANILPRVTFAIKSTADSYVDMVEHSGRAKHLFALLQEEPERADGLDFTSCAAPMETLTTQDAISIQHVSFAYPNGLQVLRGCSFTVPKGGKVALVGASGGGKSTLLKLLCGYDANYSGCISVYGHSIAQWNLTALRRQIALVNQEAYLFDMTIRENIRMGNPDASDAEVEQAAQDAYALEFITALPEGFDTQLGERGVRLSGGQCQRIAIARAMLKNAPIILLDEPTAALDTVSEAYIQQAITNLSRHKTVFVIAHRISTVRGVDRILVLENGEIIEAGTHEALLEAQGRYTELYASQLFTDHPQEGGGADDATQ